MVPTLFFYQLVLIALVWLCLMLQWGWLSDRVTAQPTPVLRSNSIRIALDDNPRSTDNSQGSQPCCRGTPRQ